MNNKRVFYTIDSQIQEEHKVKKEPNEFEAKYEKEIKKICKLYLVLFTGDFTNRGRLLFAYQDSDQILLYPEYLESS